MKNNRIYSNPETKLKRYIILSILLGILLLFIWSIIYFASPASNAGLRIYWNVPKEFGQGKTEVIDAKVYIESKEHEIKVLKESSESIEYPNEIKLSEIMSITLISSKSNGEDDFLIEPLGNTEQVIDTTLIQGKKWNVWEWNVTPINKGEASLSIKSSIYLPTANGFKAYDYPRQSIKTIIKGNFQYRAKKFLKGNWGWLMSAIVIPTWIFFFGRFRAAVKAKRSIQSKLKNEIKRIAIDELNGMKKNVQELISKDETGIAIKRFLNFSNHNNLTELSNQLVLLSSAFNDNESEYRINTISNSDYRINKSRVSKGILLLLGDINEYGTQQGISDNAP